MYFIILCMSFHFLLFPPLLPLYHVLPLPPPLHQNTLTLLPRTVPVPSATRLPFQVKQCTTALPLDPLVLVECRTQPSPAPTLDHPGLTPLHELKLSHWTSLQHPSRQHLLAPPVSAAACFISSEPYLVVPFTDHSTTRNASLYIGCSFPGGVAAAHATRSEHLHSRDYCTLSERPPIRHLSMFSDA